MSEIIERFFQADEERIDRALLPCPFCGSPFVHLEKKGTRIEYWLVSCKVCRASVKGTRQEMAVDGWNNRPSKQYVPLPTDTVSYLLPLGQKYSHIMVHEHGKVSLLDYGDDNTYQEIELDLGRFRLCDWLPKKVKEEA